MEELKGIVSTWKTILKDGGFADVTSEEVILIEQLINRVEELEKRNKDLNKKIGMYSNKLDFYAQAAESLGSELRSLTKNMCVPKQF